MIKSGVMVAIAWIAGSAMAGDFSIADFGAKTDGSNSAAAFERAMGAAAAAGGGRVVVPAGKWFSGAIRFKSNCELHLADGSEIVFSQDPNDYLPAVHTSWEGMECWNYCPLVYAYCCTNVAITGRGTLRAYEGEWKDTLWHAWLPPEQGIRDSRRQLYDWGAKGVPVAERQIWRRERAHTRPHFVQFNRCRNVRWENFKVRNSPFWTLHLYLCDMVQVRGLDVYAHGNNNDGIDVEMTRNVLIEDCTFDQGDDGVVIKSGRNRDAWRLNAPTENVLVRNCHIKDAHTVLGIGSEISGGVRNVRMENCRAETPYRVFYLKTNRRRGGFLENIVCENVTCRKARTSVFEIDMDVLYEWGRFPDYELKRTQITNVVARNLRVGEAKHGIRLIGDPQCPPRDIAAEGIVIDKLTGTATEVRHVYDFVQDGLPNLAKPRLFEAGHSLDTSVYDAAFNRVVRADRECDAKWLRLKTPEAIHAYQREVRERAIAAMGGFPERTPLNARTTGVIKCEGYRIEKVIFESRPKFFLTGHLYVPDDPKFKGPFPAMSAPCGHSPAGKAAPAYSNIGVVGARRGFVVFSYDPVDQGERFQKRDNLPVSNPTLEHNRMGVRAYLLGESAAQVRLFDGMRAIDYLASRTDIVDPKRIGVSGISGGGTLSSYVNAFEPQVACASPSGFLSTIRAVYDNCGPQDAEQVIFGQLTYALNHLGIVALRAPSPILVSTTHADFFPFYGSIDLMDDARQLFAALGAKDHLDLIEVPGVHGWYNSQKKVQYDWMERWLNGNEAAYTGDHRSARLAHLGYDFDEDRGGIAFAQPEERNVTPTGRVLDLPGAKSIYDIYREKFAAARDKRGQLTPERIRALVGIRALSELSATELPAEGGVVLSRDDDETMLPVVIARAKTPSGKPPVMIVSDVKSRPALAGTARKFLAEGRSVAIVDLRGFGETANSRHVFYGVKNGDEEIAMCLMALGDSLVARRVEDALLAAKYVAKTLGMKPLLYAEGRAVIPAAHARYVESGLFAGFRTVREPVAWDRLFADESLAFPFSSVVRGASLVYDWVELGND